MPKQIRRNLFRRPEWGWKDPFQNMSKDAVMMAFQGIAKSRIAEQKKLMIELIRRWPECGS
jgi:hypothetical protein